MTLRSGKSLSPGKTTEILTRKSPGSSRKRNAGSSTPSSSSKRARPAQESCPRARRISFDEEVGPGKTGKPVALDEAGPVEAEQKNLAIKEQRVLAEALALGEAGPAASKGQESLKRNSSAELPKEFVKMARQFLRWRLCDSRAAHLLPGVEENQRKLCDLLEHTIVQSCSNSALLLGPRGCGKSLVVETVLRELEKRFPDRFCVVRLNGLIHADDRSAFKALAKQLCIMHDLEFSKRASFGENLQFLTDVLREFSISKKSMMIIIDEFDLFAQRPKQALLYNLFNTLQSSSAQAAIIGLSCRLDADQLLEKRVRSRFSHRKMLFLRPSSEEVVKLLELVLLLPVCLGTKYADAAALFNTKIKELLQQESTRSLIQTLTEIELSPRHIMDIFFRCICDLNQELGKPFAFKIKSAVAAQKRRPTLDSLADLSVLELCLLTSMKRLEEKEAEWYNFSAIYKEYKELQSSHSTSDSFRKEAALKAFEHLLDREAIAYVDGKDNFNTSETRPVKMLLSWEELREGLAASPVCPVFLRQCFSHETAK